MIHSKYKTFLVQDCNECCGALKRWALMCMVVLCVMLSSVQAHANSKYAGLVIDADTGEVLYQDNAGRYRYPASLTKMMTLYLTFDALKAGKLTMGQRLYVSRRAEAQPPSKLGLRRGQTIRVKDAIMALIVKSGNDVSVVLAEALAGTEWQFAKLMTAKARSLGMKYTSFRNASGLHHRKQRTTAYDMARLATALYSNHSEYYPLFSKTKFRYSGRLIRGHNRVVRNYAGADGLKTGYTRASGFNLVTSAQRRDMRIVGVVLGGKSSKSRDKHMRRILDRSFRKLAYMHKRDNRTRVARTPVPLLKPSTRLKYAVLTNHKRLPQKPVVENGGYVGGVKIASAPKPVESPFRIYHLSAQEDPLIEEGGGR